MGQYWLENGNVREVEERFDSLFHGRIFLFLSVSYGKARYNHSHFELCLGKFDLESVSGNQNSKVIEIILAHSGANKGLLPSLNS